MVDSEMPATVTSSDSGADVLNMRHGAGLADQTEKRTHTGVAAHASQHAE
jgi:hypothetical protein